MNNTVEIWTDGSSRYNYGGWAFVVYEDEKQQIYSGYFYPSTNNIAELYAIKEALDYFVKHPTNANLIINSDSQYAINAATGIARARANLDLILYIRDIVKRINVTFRYQEDKDCNEMRLCHNTAVGEAEKGRLESTVVKDIEVRVSRKALLKFLSATTDRKNAEIFLRETGLWDKYK